LRMKRFFRLVSDERGGATLEAALTMPFFLAFALAFITLIQLAVIDMALRNAVTETVKQMAANTYPVALLSNEAKQAFESSKVGETVEQLIAQVSAAKQRIEQGEQWVNDYKAFIPDFLVRLVQWEQQKRIAMEQLAKDEYDRFVESNVDPIVRSAFREAVLLNSDPHVINRERLSIEKVVLPSFEQKDRAMIGIEARYEVPLAIPFFRRTVTVRKLAYERVWTRYVDMEGGGG